MKKFLVIILTVLMLFPKGALAEEDKLKEENNNNLEEDKLSGEHNNNLKELSIEGYEIDFDKYKKLYSIEVKNTVNSLEVTALPEATTSKVEIKGADNLTNNDNKVTIDVTSTDKKTKTYVINVKKDDDVVKSEVENNFKVDNKYLKYAMYFAIGSLGVGLIVFIIVKIRDKKIEKGIDKL